MFRILLKRGQTPIYECVWNVYCEYRGCVCAMHFRAGTSYHFGYDNIGQWRTLSVYADGGDFGIDLCVNQLRAA